jgi:hypothetical protein
LFSLLQKHFQKTSNCAPQGTETKTKDHAKIKLPKQNHTYPEYQVDSVCASTLLLQEAAAAVAHWRQWWPGWTSYSSAVAVY